MSDRSSPSEVTRILREGPNSERSLSKLEIRSAARAKPEAFARALIKLNLTMVREQYKRHGENIIDRYAKFVKPWYGALDDPVSEYFFGSIDTYSEAAAAKFYTIDWEKSTTARQVASRMQNRLSLDESIHSIPGNVLIGQIQSVYSREEAANTFLSVRGHDNHSLVAEFYWDTGALTYFSDEEVQERRLPSSPINEDKTWEHSTVTGNRKAIVISVDPNFYRIYAPTILHNAQQLPELDFVILHCASTAEAQTLINESNNLLDALAALTRQAAPKNIQTFALTSPTWVANQRTYYASVRFLALPTLLTRYEQLYSMDADLFLTRHPNSFLTRTKSITLGSPSNDRLTGLPPWRRHMAGAVVANRKALNSDSMARLTDYLTVGLQEKQSWMLDQNALTYSSESRDNSFTAVRAMRPAVVGDFMDSWEQNYRRANSKANS